MPFCNVRISSSRAELSKSKRGFTLVAMPPTPIEEQQFCLVNKSHIKSIKNILNLIHCPFNDKMVSSSSLALMSLKPILMKTHNYSTSTYQSSRQLKGKALTRVKILPQLLLHMHSYSLTLPCRSIAGELHMFLAFSICFIVEVFKTAICCFEKSFLQNIAIFEWLIVFTKDVKDSIGSNSCSLTVGSGVWWRLTAVLSGA